MVNKQMCDSFYAVNKKRLNDFECTFESNINIEESENVVKVLSIDGEVCNISTEVQTGETSVSGNVVFTMMYLTEANQTASVTYKTTFMTKASGDINPSSVIDVVCKSAAVNVLSLSQNVAKVSCKLYFGAFVYNNEEVFHVSNVESDVCTKQTATNYVSLVATEKSSFMENLSIQISEKVSKILNVDVYVKPKSSTCENNFMVFAMQLCAKVTYFTDEENPKIKSAVYKTDVKQEVECAACTTSSDNNYTLNIDYCNVKSSIEDQNENVSINIEVPLTLTARVFDIIENNVITDLYSTKKVTHTTSSSFENMVDNNICYFDKKIEGSLTINDENTRIDKVLAINSFTANILNQYIDNDVINISGMINGNIIYLDEDENAINSVDVEIPFVATKDSEDINSCMLDSSVMVEDVDVMVKKGKDIYVDANLCFKVTLCKNTQNVVISDLQYSEDLPQKDCNIEIYFASAGESVWDVAKQLGVSEQVIYEQNAVAGEVLENNEKISVYYKNV